jgi:hypothetical protein
MATAAILNFSNPPTKAATYYGGYSYKVDHMAPKPWISDIHHWFAMIAIWNPKWPPKCKNHPIWVKFGFQVDFDVGN